MAKEFVVRKRKAGHTNSPLSTETNEEGGSQRSSQFLPDDKDTLADCCENASCTPNKRLPLKSTFDNIETSRTFISHDILTHWKFCCPVLLTVLVLLVSFAFLFVFPTSLSKNQGNTLNPDIINNIGLDGLILFRQYDRNDDGVLSLEEFEPLAHLLREENVTKPFEYDQHISLSDEMITIKSYFQPLNLSTMSKDSASVYSVPGHLDALKGLKDWTGVTKQWINFAAKHFSIFVPPDGHLDVGHVWNLIKSSISLTGGQLSSNRYFPPRVHEMEVALHRLLAMFHPHVFLYTRFSPQGSMAVVRAVSEQYIDVAFRIHAEYQLNHFPHYPFWFTPAQFTGQVTLNRDSTNVLNFHLFVPNDRQLNVDMEWLNGPSDSENVEVDIGFLAQMELLSTAPSKPACEEVNGVKKDHRFVPLEHTEAKEPVWENEITFSEAKELLAAHMYPFKKVKYYPLKEALERVSGHQLIHSVLLWGALDDQSC